jgi:hypothetical protein
MFFNIEDGPEHQNQVPKNIAQVGNMYPFEAGQTPTN